jgi:hypothetical protein
VKRQFWVGRRYLDFTYTKGGDTESETIEVRPINQNLIRIG